MCASVIGYCLGSLLRLILSSGGFSRDGCVDHVVCHQYSTRSEVSVRSCGVVSVLASVYWYPIYSVYRGCFRYSRIPLIYNTFYGVACVTVFPSTFFKVGMASVSATSPPHLSYAAPRNLHVCGLLDGSCVPHSPLIFTIGIRFSVAAVVFFCASLYAALLETSKLSGTAHRSGPTSGYIYPVWDIIQ